jgi:alkylation response protein AidB-like acyl-CoA dehydrogenase
MLGSVAGSPADSGDMRQVRAMAERSETGVSTVARSPAARLVEDLEAALGDPDDAGTPVSFAAALADDEKRRFPAEAMDAVQRWGFAKYLVPKAFGGALGSIEDLLALFRATSRRNASLSLPLGSTMLGSNPVWLWGDAAQRARVAGHVMSGRFGGFAMSEAAHGSDLLASDVVAEPDADGYRLTGSKWPIGNATRGEFLTVFARTGPSAFSLLLVDHADLEPGRWRNEAGVNTLGLRGHDLSGVTFDDCPVPGSALLGAEHTGFAQALKTLQITRALVPSISLGSADTALRLALRYTRQRRLYGRTAYDLAVIRQQLLTAYLDLLVCECVAVPVARSMSVLPARLSLWSSVSKYLVPKVINGVLADIAEVLGARHFICDDPGTGMFQKLQRDHAIASVFEGTTHVNLHLIARQLPSVLRETAPGPGLRDTLTELFSRTTAAPDWVPDSDALLLFNEGRDEVGQGFATSLAELEAAADDPAAPASLRTARAAARLLDARWRDLRASLAGLRKHDRMLHTTVAGLRAADTYCLLFAAASCLHTWTANRAGLGDRFAGGAWLAGCLHRLLERLGGAPLYEMDPAVEQELLRCLDDNRLFSVVPLRLG